MFSSPHGHTLGHDSPFHASLHGIAERRPPSEGPEWQTASDMHPDKCDRTHKVMLFCRVPLVLIIAFVPSRLDEPPSVARHRFNDITDHRQQPVLKVLIPIGQVPPLCALVLID